MISTMKQGLNYLIPKKDKDALCNTFSLKIRIFFFFMLIIFFLFLNTVLLETFCCFFILFYLPLNY